MRRFHILLEVSRRSTRQNNATITTAITTAITTNAAIIKFTHGINAHAMVLTVIPSQHHQVVLLVRRVMRQRAPQAERVSLSSLNNVTSTSTSTSNRPSPVEKQRKEATWSPPPMASASSTFGTRQRPAVHGPDGPTAANDLLTASAGGHSSANDRGGSTSTSQVMLPLSQSYQPSTSPSLALPSPSSKAGDESTKDLSQRFQRYLRTFCGSMSQIRCSSGCDGQNTAKRKRRQCLWTILVILLVINVASPPTRRMFLRQFTRPWARRYELMCQSYVYPPLRHCGATPVHARPEQLPVQGSSIHYISAKFGWPPTRFQSQVEQTKEAIAATRLIPDSNLHFYHQFPAFIQNDPRWRMHLQFQDPTTPVPSRGGGYWFWKAPLLLHHADAAQQDGFLIFSDIDTVYHMTWIDELMRHMIRHDHNLALYELEFVEREWVKRDVYLEICGDTDDGVLSSNQYNGAFLMLRLKDGIIAFLRTWQDWCARYHWINDEASTVPNLPTFQEHRHDQALLSLLIKCRYAGSMAQRELFYKPAMGDWKMYSMKI